MKEREEGIVIATPCVMVVAREKRENPLGFSLEYVRGLRLIPMGQWLDVEGGEYCCNHLIRVASTINFLNVFPGTDPDYWALIRRLQASRRTQHPPGALALVLSSHR